MTSPHDGMDGAFRAPAADRWASAVCGGATAQDDLRTIGQWAGHIGVSVPTLRAWCYVPGASPKDSLILCRLVRAISVSSQFHCHPFDLLDVRDPRTLRRLLAKAGLAARRESPLTLDILIEMQRLVQSPLLVRALARRVALDWSQPISRSS